MPTPRIAVLVERGPRRSFASALDWPGWCRSAIGTEAALEALAAYAPRYAPVAARAGLALPKIAGVAGLEVVETVAGSAMTDLGAPGAVGDAERRPLDAAAARRMAALLDAAWRHLEAVAATAPAELRKGPRGGGRDRATMVAHVVDAERSYARKIGVACTAAEWRSGGVALLRARIRDVLERPSDGSAPVERGWPAAYIARRAAWHALDHAWEMEDRSG